ncbi:O-antigen ligase family protein [Flavobacterium lindanitolerans]|uniref:O-antigen ligase family protein n=1 Tax=Flavobacterium lindanitolerans TaxID=428988 RepID=UPI0031D067D9
MSENSLLRHKVLEFVIIFNCLFLLLPNKFKAYPIIIFFLVSIHYKIKSNQSEPFPLKKVATIAVLFILYFLSFFYSYQTAKTLSKLSTMSSIVGFPIIFGILYASGFRVSKSLRNRMFIIFNISILIFLVLSFLYFWNQEFTLSQTVVHYSNLINIRLKAFSIHPIYLSIYIGTGILTLISLFKENELIKARIFYVFLILFFSIALAILMRRGPILSLIISIAFLLQSFFKFKRALIGVILIIGIVFAGIKYLPKYKNENRFNDFTNQTYKGDIDSSVGIRYNIYKCCIEKIMEKPVIGYGIGNVQKNLDPCYKEKGIDLSKKSYNSHNQYFSILLHTGFLGLLIYFFSLIKIFKDLFKNKLFIGVAVLLFFLLSFLTENVIERENGMLLYSFILCIFLFSKKNYSPN